MTLQELWMVIVRRWKLVVALPVVCALACGGWLMLSKGSSAGEYTAEAYIVANSQVAGVAGIATGQARELADGDGASGVTVTAKADTATLTVTVTATGPNADECVEAANSIAEAANETAEEAYSNFENPYAGTVQLALEAEDSASSGGSVKYLIVAILAGLFVAVCIVVVLDMLKRPVKTPEGVQEAVELPVLEILPAQNGERLLANVRFAANSARASGEGGGSPMDLSSVLVVPVGDEDAAQAACDLLDAAVSAEGGSLKVEKAQPLSQGMAGAYASQEAGAVVVTARQWADTLPQLESTVAELRLAGANLAGIAFAKGELA